MSIEYGDKNKLEQQKLEQKESDKPKTGTEALDFLKKMGFYRSIFCIFYVSLT